MFPETVQVLVKAMRIQEVGNLVYSFSKLVFGSGNLVYYQYTSW